MATTRTIKDVEDSEISEAFQQVGDDLLQACIAAGEKEHRIAVDDAADAVFNFMHLSYTDDAFPRIRRVLRKHYISGSGKYIYL